MIILKQLIYLVSTLGLSIFQPLAVQKSAASDLSNMQYGEICNDLIFHIKSKGAEASGRYTQEGFIVLASSRLIKPDESYKYWYPKVWEQLISDEIIKPEADNHLLTQDYLFSSPSAASTVLLGRNSNGWTEWKSSGGRTLHDVYRK